MSDVIAMNESFAPRPHILFVLDIEPEVGLARVNSRGSANEFEKLADLRASAGVFATFRESYVVHVDGSASEDQVHAQVMAAFDKALFDATCVKEGTMGTGPRRRA